MKNWFAVICLGTITLYTQAEQNTLSSTINAVTVYTDRAAITRHAEIQLPAGEHELRFENLPARLEDNSLQISAKGTVPATILDVTSRQEYLISSANERLQKLDEQVQALQEQTAQLDDKNVLLKNQTNFINQMQNTAIGISDQANRPSANQIQEIMNLTISTQAELLAETRTITTERDKLTRQLSVLQNQLYPLQRERNLQVKNVTVRVQLEQPGKIQLDLTYITYGARWHPTYDARLNTKDRKLALSYLGVVTQQTGEDWKNVALTLSTAKPSLGGNAPTLGNWQLTEYKPSATYYDAKKDSRRNREVVYQESSSAYSDSDTLMGATGLAKQKAAPANFQTVTVDMGATSAAFNISERTSLPSDGSQQKVAITTLDLASQLQYITIPRLQQTAYLQADTNNSSDFPLLGGPLSIFMDGRFIATGALKSTMPNESFKLDLGADEGIAVTFKQLKVFNEKTGLITSGERLTYEYLITIQNNKARAEKIIINDHIPASQTDKIVVKLVSPKTGVTQNKEGKLTWDLLLEPNQKQEIPLTFTVDYPANIKVSGL